LTLSRNPLTESESLIVTDERSVLVQIQSGSGDDIECICVFDPQSNLSVWDFYCFTSCWFVPSKIFEILRGQSTSL